MPERPTPEQFKAPQEGREGERAELIRLAFEYVDAEGEQLGTAEIELEGPEVEVEYKASKSGEPGKARRVRSFVLRGEKDGEPTEVDMMALANRHGVQVLSATEHLENYYYDDKKDVAVVPPLGSPLDVGVFLHELGHADQYRDERFKKVTPLYGRSSTATRGDFTMSYLGLSELLDAVADAVPDARTAIDTEGLAQMRRLEDRRNEALDRKERYDRALIEQERMRNEELQLLVESALGKRVDPLELMAAVAEVAAKESAARGASGEPRRFGRSGPLERSEAVAALVDRLTDAGVRFREEYDEDGLDERPRGPEDAYVPAERELPGTMLSEFAVTTADQAMAVLAAVRDMEADKAELRYDAAAEELVVRFPFVASGAKDALALRLDVGRDDFERYAKQREAADREVRLLEQRNDAAFQEAEDAVRAQRLLMDGLAMKDVAALPTRMMERDATRRALQWARAVRQRAGVDLLAPHRVAPESLAAMGGADRSCEASVEQGMTGGEADVEASVLADLKRALGTYGADKMRLRRPGDDDGPGFTPIAGKGRSER